MLAVRQSSYINNNNLNPLDPTRPTRSYLPSVNTVKLNANTGSIVTSINQTNR